MEKRYIIRILTWGLAFTTFLALGIYGLLLNSNNNGDRIIKDNSLNNIVRYFNSSIVTRDLEDDGISIESYESDYTIIVSYSSPNENKTYQYTYADDILSTSFKNTDNSAREVLKIMLASVAENLGEDYASIIVNFDNIDLTTYSLNEGLTYEITNVTTVNINTKTALRVQFNSEEDIYSNF